MISTVIKVSYQAVWVHNILGNSNSAVVVRSVGVQETGLPIMGLPEMSLIVKK